MARVKWNTHAAIEDLPREQQIITSVGRSAAEYGLPRLDAERFFQAQVDASKTIQLALTREFTDARRPPFPTVPSLDTDIRPRLDRLTPELLHALSAAMPLLTRPEGRQTLARRSRRGAPKGPGGVQAMEVAVGPLLARR